MTTMLLNYLQNIIQIYYTYSDTHILASSNYLLLAFFFGPYTVNYGPSFFPPIYSKKKENPHRKNEANKKLII